MSEPATAERLPVDDEVLMARYAAGDVEAFAALYERYEGPVLAFCLRMIGEREAAEDAFQDVFVSLVEQRRRYRDRGRFRSWLFTIARHTCLDRARAGARRARLLELDAPGRRRSAASPEGALESRDEVVRALAALPAEHREIVLLHHYAGFSYAEIAEMTASTPAAVKQKAYRALTALRKSEEAAARGRNATTHEPATPLRPT